MEGVRCHYVTQVMVKGVVKGAVTGWFELSAQAVELENLLTHPPIVTLNSEGYQQSLEELVYT